MYTQGATVSPQQSKHLNLDMFKAYDIRTKSSKLDEELSLRLIRAVGRYFKEVLEVNQVVLGRDARLAAPALLELAVDFLPAMGLEVIVNPLQISTCQFYFSCMQNPQAAAIMFTASHNPGSYIGMKLMAPQMQTLAFGSGPAGGIAAIRQFYLENQDIALAKVRSKVIVRRYLDQFINYSIQLAHLKSDTLAEVSILLDFLGGSSGTEITEALQACGAKVRVRNLIPDGRFPAGDPNPIVLESIRPTWELMKREAFNFSFCFDGDGDRMDIMDSRGEQLAPSFNLAILIPEIISYFKEVHASGFFGSNAFLPHMYYDVKANPPSVVAQASQGINVHVIRNGHSFIKEALRSNVKNQYLVASEESAHYYMNFPNDLNNFNRGFAATENTLFFTLLTASMWTQHPERYQKAFDLQESLYREREWPIHFFEERLLEQVMHEVEEAFRKQGLATFTEMEDGSSLDATLMRGGLPEIITQETKMTSPWLQVAQRISRSEEGIARWEVSSNSQDQCSQAVGTIKEITDSYVQQGKAEYLE